MTKLIFKGTIFPLKMNILETLPNATGRQSCVTMAKMHCCIETIRTKENEAMYIYTVINDEYKKDYKVAINLPNLPNLSIGLTQANSISHLPDDNNSNDGMLSLPGDINIENERILLSKGYRVSAAIHTAATWTALITVIRWSFR